MTQGAIHKEKFDKSSYIKHEGQIHKARTNMSRA